MKKTLFEVKGGFDISKKNNPFLAANGDIIGYTLPDGRIVRLVTALEIEDPKTDIFEYISCQSDMEELGFKNLNYSDLTFFP
jgi:hypothetical protein